MQKCHHFGNDRSCIGHVPIFSSLSYEEMREVAGILSSRSLEKGEMVYRAGDIGKALFILSTGRVKLSRLNVNGKEQVLQIVEQGEFIGELSLFSSLPLTNNAQALENSSMCVLEEKQLKELMTKYPSIAFKVMDELSRRLEKAEKRIETTSLSSVTQRVTEALLELSDGKDEIILPMTKADLASQLGMSQETLSRKLTELQEDALIELKGRKKIIIKNQSKLEEIGQGAV